MNDMMGKMRDLLKPWMRGTSPLEIRRAVLDDAESRIVAVGEGKRIYPHNHLRVHLLVPDPEERVRFEAVVREAWDLQREIAERLAERGCPLPAGFAVEVAFDEEAHPRYGDRRFYVEYLNREAPAAAPVAVAAPGPSGVTAAGAERPALELTVLKGVATQRVYELDSPRVYLGRLEEVTDPDGRVRRRNDVAFLEVGEINSTVSREHARIAWDAESGGWWLRAEQNASGTRIYRGGRTIDVSSNDRRGVRLQPGDEIYLGRACVKVGMRAPE
ncbi:MAG TPA: FHA domain-containing protein [Thermoanaerobaculia bacterium]|nr:FHA domain-containing protein [Thermoanaerobaculia bacterium]